MQDSQEDETTVSALKAEIDDAWRKVQDAQGREVELQSTIDRLRVRTTRVVFIVVLNVRHRRSWTASTSPWSSQPRTPPRRLERCRQPMSRSNHTELGDQ